MITRLFLQNYQWGKYRLSTKDQEPIDGFKQVDPEIEDLYFATINELGLKEKI